MKLYDYFRSTASYRVRIALSVKQMSYDKLEVHLVKNGGEQHMAAYKALNPQELVPTLVDHGQALTQSLAIIEYLDEILPTPPLLPATPLARASVRSMAMTVACDMHPLNNLRVLNRLKEQFLASQQAIQSWYHHWLALGFTALEARLEQDNNSYPFCFGNAITLADICLIPQVFNAERFEFAMDDYPRIQRINAHCLTLDAFKKAAPSS